MSMIHCLELSQILGLKCLRIPKWTDLNFLNIGSILSAHLLASWMHISNSGRPAVQNFYVKGASIARQYYSILTYNVPSIYSIRTATSTGVRK